MNEVSVDVRNDGITKIEKIGMMLMETAEAMATVMPKSAVMVIAKDLESENIQDVNQALVRCRRECSGRMSLKDIRDRMPSLYPGPNEAWAIVVESRFWDEYGSREGMLRAIVESFPLSIWNSGDKIGARMAFIESYKKNLTRYGGELSHDPISIEHQKDHLSDETIEDIEWRMKNCRDELEVLDPENIVHANRIVFKKRLLSYYESVWQRKNSMRESEMV